MSENRSYFPQKRRPKPDAGTYALANISKCLNLDPDSLYTVEFYDPSSHSFIMRSIDNKYFTVTVVEVDPTLIKRD